MKTNSPLFIAMFILWFIICIVFSQSSIMAQKQTLSGSGTPNFKYIKEERLKDQNKQAGIVSDKLHRIQSDLMKRKNATEKLRQAGSLKSNRTPDGLQGPNNMTAYFYTMSCLNIDTFNNNYPTNALISFYAEIYTNYSSNLNDITVTCYFGDGTSVSEHPILYFADSANQDFEYFGVTFHAYSNPGIFIPTCTITSLYDTLSMPLDLSCDSVIMISSFTISPPKVDYFEAYSNQWCDSLSYHYTSSDIWLSYFAMSIQDPHDIITINMDFGDGTDTTIVGTLYDYCSMSFNWGGGWGYYYPDMIYWKSHVYAQPGSYAVTCIVNLPGGLSDTVTSATNIGDGCIEIAGNAFIDNNNNCIKDPGETGIPYMWLSTSYNLTWDSIYYYHKYDCYNYNSYAITDSLGRYSFFIPNTCDFIDTIFAWPYWNFYPMMLLPIACPSNGYYPFNTDTSSYDNDFAFGCQSGFDLMGFVDAWRLRPGFQGSLYPYFMNYACDSVSGTATFIIDHPGNMSIDSVVPNPAAIMGDTIIWTFNNISIYDWWNTTEVYVTLDPSVQQGDTIFTTLILDPKSGDNDRSNNIVKDYFIVSNSWDPNEKKVLPMTDDIDGAISPDQELTYIIHFQNSGTDTAYNIYITDTLAASLNLASCRVLASSHYMEFSLNGRTLEFDFPYIMLPDSNVNNPASMGFVCYRISPMPGLPGGTQIYNTAQIFFDFNPAVVTNTTLNTIISPLVVNSNALQNEITVYPNPAGDHIYIETGMIQDNSSIALYNVLGDVIYSASVNTALTEINVKNIKAGIYILRVFCRNNPSVFKIMIGSK
jgi:uncharacterized repeat protein (TIGR01451 family)